MQNDRVFHPETRLNHSDYSDGDGDGTGAKYSPFGFILNQHNRYWGDSESWCENSFARCYERNIMLKDIFNGVYLLMHE